VTACENEYSIMRSSAVVGLLKSQTFASKRKMLAKYDGRRSNGFKSSPFCSCRAFDRQATISDSGCP
jgi:hypothetical protein